MAKPYSMDLRERVVAAGVVGGMSCHAAAKRFGLGGSSAITRVWRGRDDNEFRLSVRTNNRVRPCEDQH